MPPTGCDCAAYLKAKAAEALNAADNAPPARGAIDTKAAELRRWRAYGWAAGELLRRERTP